MRPFQLTNKAKSDLRDIALFTSRRWGREQRNIYLKQFDDSFWLLAENPDIGKACDELKHNNCNHRGSLGLETPRVDSPS
ncbi:Plasmid stabilization element ParE, putative [Vibrio cholerae]|nr:Plasmid stabilization element ParE, putative [Vibrio cholerae]